MRAHWWGLIAALTLTACGQKQVRLVQKPLEMRIADMPAASDGAKLSVEVSSQRFLAIRHHVELEVQGDAVEATLVALTAVVSKEKGLLISSSFSRGEFHNASAELSFRLPPSSVASFFSTLKGSGEIRGLRTENEDKTAEVVDVDARLKNLTDVRDRMRKLLAERPAKLSDVVELEKSLSDTQAELDSMTARRQVLSRETDLVRLDVNISSKANFIERPTTAPLEEAWRSAGTVFFGSLAGLLTTLIALLPWIPVILGGLFVLRKGWRYRTMKHAERTGK